MSIVNYGRTDFQSIDPSEMNKKNLKMSNN